MGSIPALESSKDDYSILVKFCVGAPDQELDFQMTLQAIPSRGLGRFPQLVLSDSIQENDDTRK